MSRLTQVVAPMLRAAQLDIREVHGAGGEVHELVITNPRFPEWGKVVVDREGLMQWDFWGALGDDAGAAQLATVITVIMAARPGDDAARYGTRPVFQSAVERERPHP
jgi:hypothetical protein